MQSASSSGIIFSQDRNVWLLPLTRNAKPQPLLTGDSTKQFGEVSPDGQWLLYQSDESGRNDVYVTSFPARTGRWLVSENGGILPKWSATGQEIFYLSQDHSTLFSAAVRTHGAAFRVSSVQRLFSAPMVAGRGYPYDVSRNGSRFLVVVSSGVTTPLTLVVDWPSELKR